MSEVKLASPTRYSGEEFLQRTKDAEIRQMQALQRRGLTSGEIARRIGRTTWYVDMHLNPSLSRALEAEDALEDVDRRRAIRNQKIYNDLKQLIKSGMSYSNIGKRYGKSRTWAIKFIERFESKENDTGS